MDKACWGTVWCFVPPPFFVDSLLKRQMKYTMGNDAEKRTFKTKKYKLN